MVWKYIQGNVNQWPVHNHSSIVCNLLSCMLSSHTDYVMLSLVAHVANKERILEYFIHDHLFEVQLTTVTQQWRQLNFTFFVQFYLSSDVKTNLYLSESSEKLICEITCNAASRL